MSTFINSIKSIIEDLHIYVPDNSTVTSSSYNRRKEDIVYTVTGTGTNNGIYCITKINYFPTVNKIVINKIVRGIIFSGDYKIVDGKAVSDF
jgi:hypothetical protein